VKRAGRRALWALFWAGAALSSVIVLLFLWAAIPAAVAIAQGGWAQLWFFGNTGYVVSAAALYLVVAACIFIRRARRRRLSDITSR